MSSEPFSDTPKSDRLSQIFQHLLALPGAEVGETVHQTAQLVAQALRAEKVDIFLDDPANQRLVAVGTSLTPLGIKQKAIGMDRIALSEGEWSRSIKQVSPTGPATAARSRGVIGSI